ncbi:MAG: hypothetical protein CMH90_02600 [Oceanicaulis sp.]|nr:hypothetical protein [Oceanicaulis sp.]HCR66844.1 hypothetical protein [Oceanicaulis sp.]|tara:strand:+ start:1324 stop:1509 length:186 start_codon:yes stop_codon:yes gene_type:complete
MITSKAVRWALVSFAILIQLAAATVFPQSPQALRAFVAGSLSGVPISIILMKTGLISQKTA